MNLHNDLSQLLQAMVNDFPVMLRENLVGIYLWGSLTYDASTRPAAMSIE